MKTIKIIDLYNKIANGEEVPKKFRYLDSVYELTESYYNYDYRNKDNKIFENVVILERLNDEVEIIEDKTEDPIVTLRGKLNSIRKDLGLPILEDKKIDDRARFQYSQIPIWTDMIQFIRITNDNFERHQQALNEIIDKVNGK